MDVPPPTSGALAQPARARIFAFLAGRRAAAGTDEVAAHLGLHPNGVRRHLKRLHREGLVEHSRVHAGRGRPRDSWRVAPGARPTGAPPHAYAELSSWLARSIPATPGRLRSIERTGREIGGEIAADSVPDPAEAVRDAFAALGFDPTLERDETGFACRLGNCPFRDAVRQNRDAICGLHRGITAGILAELDPRAKLTRFEPRDPDMAGCVVEVRTSGG